MLRTQDTDSGQSSDDALPTVSDCISIFRRRVRSKRCSADFFSSVVLYSLLLSMMSLAGSSTSLCPELVAQDPLVRARNVEEVPKLHGSHPCPEFSNECINLKLGVWQCQAHSRFYEKSHSTLSDQHIPSLNYEHANTTRPCRSSRQTFTQDQERFQVFANNATNRMERLVQIYQGFVRPRFVLQ